jgi:hypothetical protein
MQHLEESSEIMESEVTIATNLRQFARWMNGKLCSGHERASSQVSVYRDNCMQIYEV